jgi:general secretion pathway protein I
MSADPRYRRRRRFGTADRGFTLLEVVVALAIASFALIASFRAGSTGLFAVDVAARTEEAVERAQSHLAALARDGAVAAQDDTGDDGGGFRWHLRIRPIAVHPSPAPGSTAASSMTLFDVQIAISWTSRHRAHAVVLRTERVALARASE